MTPKQKRFVEEYALDHNAAAAARRAGYAEHSARITGSQLLTNPNVSRAIQAIEDTAALKLSLTREDALNGLLAAKDEAVEKSDPMAQVAAWREIGKMCGFYSPERHKVEVNDRGRAYMESMASLSEAELLAIICAEPVLE